MAFYEHHQRSLTKTVTFRVLIILSDFIVIYFITHRYDLTLDVVIATNLASTVLYFFHERVWNKISWGKEAK